MGKSFGTLMACTCIAPVFALELVSVDYLCNCTCVYTCIYIVCCMFACVCMIVTIVFALALRLCLHLYCTCICIGIAMPLVLYLCLHLGCTCVILEEILKSAFALASACCGVRWHMLVTIACSFTCTAVVVRLFADI